MKFFFWGSTKVTPSTWQTIILPASFIMICQQLKQNIFWKQKKYNCWCSSILALDHYTDSVRKISNFYQEATLCIYSLNHWWIYTQNEQFFLLTLVAYAKSMWQDNFPQHHKNSDSSAEDKNSPPSVCHYSKRCCLVGKIVEPWFHLGPHYYLHVWELFNNNSPVWLFCGL